MKLVFLLMFLFGSAFAAQINGAGASFPANVYMAWVKEYEKASGIKVNYQSIGSGGGIKQIKARTIDFGASDEPLSEAELKESNLAQFPSLTGAIVLAYNIENIKDGELKLSNEALEGIFLGKITKWNDDLIKKDNPNLNLPNLDISVVYRSDGSGTTFNFTSYLSKISKDFKNEIGAGKAVSFKTGVGAKGNEGVAHLISRINGAIGYIELSYKNSLNLDAAQLKNSDNQWTFATKDLIEIAGKNAKWSDVWSADLLLSKGAYPLVSATYILIPKDANKNIAEFFKFCFENGDSSALKMGLIPLQDSLKKEINKYLDSVFK